MQSRSPSPVSYTHLDVYKRQVRVNDRATQERLNAAGAQAYHSAVEKLIARAEAVRPTPIKEQDVYKRQVLSCVQKPLRQQGRRNKRRE